MVGKFQRIQTDGVHHNAEESQSYIQDISEHGHKDQTDHPDHFQLIRERPSQHDAHRIEFFCNICAGKPHREKTDI